MKTVMAFAAVAFITILSVAIERHDLRSEEYLKADLEKVKTIEAKVVAYEKNIEALLEGGSNGIN